MKKVLRRLPHTEDQGQHGQEPPPRLPVPSPDAEAYERNFSRGMARFADRRRNHDRYNRKERGAHLDYLPIKLDLENVSRCNFHCAMCTLSDWRDRKRAGDMSFEDFKRVLDSQHGLFEIKLQGVGEPFLGGDSFFEMIRYARSKHIWVRTATNASLLHLNNNYKKLIDSDVNEVQISIDGASQETFEKIRRGSRFEGIVENCKLINAYCNNLGMLRTRMWVLLQASNLHEFFQFIELAHGMGFRRLTFSLDLHGWGVEKWIAANRKITVEHGLERGRCVEAIERGRRLGLEVTFWNVASKYSTRNTETLCAWPFERAFVSSDLRIVPCCMIANPEVLDLGDARDFTNNWNSSAYQDFRRAHLEGRIPKVCQVCYESQEDGR